MTNEELATVLEQVKELIGTAETWCQYAPARDAESREVESLSPEARQWCLIGATHRILGGSFKHMDEVIDKLRQELRRSPTDSQQLRHSLAYYNDASTTTHQDILEILDRTIAALQGGKERGG